MDSFERELRELHHLPRDRFVAVDVDVLASPARRRGAYLDWLGRAFVVLVIATMVVVGVIAGAAVVVFIASIL